MTKFFSAARLQHVVSLAAAGAMLATFAAPAYAAEKSKSAPAAAAALAGAAASTGFTSARPADKKYCITDTLPATRMPKTMCKTQQEWFTAHVDLPAR